MQCMLFNIWLLLFKFMLVRMNASIFLCAVQITRSHCYVVLPCVPMKIYLPIFAVSRYLGDFQFWALRNNIVMNVVAKLAMLEGLL
jgi:hypothetical protein